MTDPAAAVTEYAIGVTGSAFSVRTTEDDPSYPLEEWLEDCRRTGSRVCRRRIVVIDDWAEVLAPGMKAQLAQLNTQINNLLAQAKQAATQAAAMK